MRAQALGEKPLDDWIFEHAVGEHEQLLSILRSLRFDRREIYAVNLPNGGTVPNLPPDAVLEVPAVATAAGLYPMQVPDVSDALAAVLTRKLAATRLTVEAALTCDRRLFVEALLADGAVTDRGTAEELTAALLDAQRDHLPAAWFVDESG